MAGEPTVVVGFTGAPVDVGEFGMTTERVVRVRVPSTFGREHLALAQQDIEAITGAFRDYPDDFVAMQNAALRHDFAGAEKIAKRIGLTEEQLIERGGGQVAVAGLILAGLVLLAVVIGSHEGGGDHTIVGPDGGVPDRGDGGAPDAGPG